jgi:serine/threonine-protein phosphatase PGAM5
VANRFLYLARHGEAIDDGDLSEVGRQQARLLGQRLSPVPLSVIAHGPLPRAVQTAELIAEYRPAVPVHCSELLGDYVPAVPEILPPALTHFFDGCTADELAEGADLAARAIARYAVPAERETHELIVTHSFLIAWFVRHALDAPVGRWLGLNQCNAGLTVLLYRPERPPSLVQFNDLSHLPEALRWTGFPPELRP